MHPTLRRAHARTALVATLTAAALVATLTSPSFADKKDDLEKQKKEANSAAADAKKDLDGSTKEFAAATASLKAAQGRLDAAKATLGATRGRVATAKAVDAQMQARLAKTQAALVVARAQLSEGEDKLEASEVSIQQFAVRNLQQGDPGLRALSGLLDGDSPDAFVRQVDANEAVSNDQLATMQKLDATRVILKLNNRKVRKLRDQVKVQREQAAANLVEKQRLEKIAEGQAAEVSKLVSKRRGAFALAKRAQAEDDRQYREKVAESNKLSAQLRALAAKQVKTGGKGSGGDGGGTLSYPVVGYPITSPYGMRVHPITGVYKLHDGTDFGVPCGTPVHAAAGGTIIQQYFNGAYGNRVILNNGVKRGVNVVTTYNHLTRFVLPTGAKVKRGQVIAYSGTTGYSTGCHLHFMVLVNGATVNPMGWL